MKCNITEAAFAPNHFGLTKYEYAIIHVTAGFAANPFLAEVNIAAKAKGLQATPLGVMAKSTVDNLFKLLNREEEEKPNDTKIIT